MSRYDERFSTKALSLFDRAVEYGKAPPEERFWFEHTTNPLGIREVAQILGTAGHVLS